MAELAFADPSRVHLLWAVLVLAGLLAWLELRSRDVLGRFLSPTMQRRLVLAPSRARRLARIGLVALSLALGVLALMRPRTPGRTESVAGRSAADLMVVLDVSRSMLAEDAAPNRLGRAKAEVAELLERLEGQRVGLIAFAGRAAVLCPLTPDHGFFRMVLRGADTRSVSRGGTRIGEALRKAVEAYGPADGARLVLLITDGEDHDSYPLEAAREAREAGIRVVAIGFGSEAGSPITLVDPETGARHELRDSSGQVVRSRLDGELLRQIALETEGVYVPAGTSALDLESIVETHLRPLVKASSEPFTRRIPVERYRWFVLAALACLAAAVAVGSFAGRRLPA